MAEGGEPGPKEETHAEGTFEYPTWNWDRGSLEYVFASDFIHFVIDTEDIGWRSHRLIEHRSPLTPFNTTMQKVVEKILRTDSTYLKLVFQSMTERCGKLNQVRFNVCAVFLKMKYFGPIRRSFGHLLKYFCVVGLFSAWALGQGLYTAPFFCVDIILGYLREFLVDNGFTSMDAFWFAFEQYASDALSLPKIHMLNEEDLRSLPDMQKLMEEQFAETNVADSFENLEPEVEILPECTEGESSGEKISPKKEESKDVKVETPSKEATGSDVQISEAQPPTDGAASSDVKTPEAQPPTDEAASSDVKIPEAQPPTDEAAGSVTKTSEELTTEAAGSVTKTSEELTTEATGSDTKTSEAQGPTTEGSDVKTSEAPATGSDTKASESPATGSDTKTSESPATGSDTKTSEAPTTEAAGSATKASEAQGPTTEGSDTKTSEAPATVSDTKTSEAPTTEAAGSATKTSEAHGPTREGSDAKTSEAPATEATGSDVKTSETQKPLDKKETKNVATSKGATKPSGKKETKNVSPLKGATKPSDKKEAKNVSPLRRVTKPSDKKETKSDSPAKGSTSVQPKSQGASQPSKPGGKKESSKTPSRSPGAPKQKTPKRK